MFAPKSKIFAYSFFALILTFGLVTQADAKTIVIGEVTDSVSIPGILLNSGLGGASYWNLNGTSLFASSTGYNVGIGTTAPTAGVKLHVNGNLLSSGSVSFTGPIYAGGGNRMITVDNAGVLGAAAIPVDTNTDVYWSGTATNLVAATGRTSLGLGSIALLNAIFSSNISDGTIANVDISSSAAIAASKIQYGTYFIDSVGTNGQYWKSDGVGAGYWASESGALSGSGTANYITKWSATSTLANSVIYDNGTNVGFGLTAPSTKIDIQGSGATGLTLNTDLAQTTDSNRLFFKSAGHTFALMNDESLFTIRTGATAGSGSGVSRFAMDTTGNVGVGTSAPGAKLHVVGSLQVTSSITTNLTGAGNRMVIADASGVLGQAAIPAALPTPYTNGNTMRANGTAWVSVSNLYNDGTNIGIGTTTPGSYRLKVSGSIAANEFIYLSDRRAKDNISTLNGSIEKILALRGVSFTWKENGKKSLGLIAQEVEQVYPELVTESNNIKSVQYGNLVAPLIEAVKEQQRQIEDLEQRISELENNNK